MDKKNTVLLTVIAVATLLVAVVGSTFAFFAIQETNNADVKVETTTAAGSDIFSATGAGSLSLTVNNDDMLQANGGKEDAFLSVEDKNMKVSLTAGTGVATCNYDIVWTETSAIPYARSTYVIKEVEYTAEGNEYTLAGVAKNPATDTIIDDIAIAEINISDIQANAQGQKVLGSFKISNTAGSAATEHNWTFTNKFYNLAVDQGDQMGKTYAGNITVSNVSCENKAE